MAEFILINLGTTEVEFFSTREQAKQFVRDNGLLMYNKEVHEDIEELEDICIIMPCVEVNDKEDVELVIYANENNNTFGSTAEYQEDVFNSDFIDEPNEPVRYMHAYDFENNTFITDLEKMVDLLQAIMSEDNATAYDEFLHKHDDVTENELDDTVKEINTETLADLYRQAENAYIEELNGRPTGLPFSSETAKAVIGNYVYNSGLLDIPQQKEFEEICSSMGC